MQSTVLAVFGVSRSGRVQRGDKLIHKRAMGPFYFDRVERDDSGTWLYVMAPGINAPEAYRPEAFADIMVREIPA